MIAKDDDSDRSAVVTVKPSIDGFYRIDVKVYKFNDGYTAGRFGILIFHE